MQVQDIMTKKVLTVRPETTVREVAEILVNHKISGVPVVEDDGRLVGIVTVDDVIDVMEAEATEDFELMAAMTPSDKPYSRTGAAEMWKRRVPWLMFLMLSATFTSMIINSFEDALATQAVLISFIPMLMGTGGNSGAQAATAVIRSLSLGETETKDVLKVLWREIRVAVLCGVTLACVNFVKLLLVDRMLLNNAAVTIPVALTICVTLVFVVIFAKVVGCTLPMAAEKIGLDPAVMAAPLITTLTDTVSLLIYFQFATTILGI